MMMRMAMLVVAALPAVLAAASPTYRESDFNSVPKLDAHVHARVADPSVLAIARKDGFQLLSIIVDYEGFPSIAVQAEAARQLYAAEPHRFHFATAFSMQGFGTPGWTERTNRSIDETLAQEAVAVKVWKNIGMGLKDSDGHRIFIDDPRFDGVMRHLEERRIPLIAHQGEPQNCWLPLDKMTTENDRSYFREHPQYYMYLHPEEPSYEQLMAARDRFVARHPKLAFDGAHMASLEWSVDRLAAFLDRYPNAVVDLAARMTQVQVQSNANRAKVRNFFLKYQDRLMYGTDLTLNPPDPASKNSHSQASSNGFAKEADDSWRSDWRYLATPLAQYVDAIAASSKGLALPRTVIDKIYFGNARRVFHLPS